MRHEKIIRREDGSRIKIEVSVYMDGHGGGKPRYDFTVTLCEKGKRTFKGVHNFDYDYTWRAMSMEDRKKYCKNKYLEYVSTEEVNQAFLELWEMLKPDGINK
ncbi:MAG: hypothetical protein GY793_11870 [Proteobacteria bacterium]|nr:hypothetical protein [Pseudomonadota bacterium]